MMKNRMVWMVLVLLFWGCTEETMEGWECPKADGVYKLVKREGMGTCPDVDMTLSIAPRLVKDPTSDQSDAGASEAELEGGCAISSSKFYEATCTEAVAMVCPIWDDSGYSIDQYKWTGSYTPADWEVDRLKAEAIISIELDGVDTCSGKYELEYEWIEQ